MSETITGGGLCGAVRHERTAPAQRHLPRPPLDLPQAPGRALSDSCRRRSQRVPAAAWHRQHRDDNVSTCDSSEGTHRHFCKTCGAHVFEDVDSKPDAARFPVGTRDDGADPGGRTGSECHIFRESRTGWYEPDDMLSHAAFPFRLSNERENDSHRGVARLCYDAGHRKVTCPLACWRLPMSTNAGNEVRIPSMRSHGGQVIQPLWNGVTCFRFGHNRPDTQDRHDTLRLL
ncbi:MAG: GFA family protein [Rhodospirillales bacterium]|nr:GFA family protein [Rhodospirillales bacterium]